MRGLLTMAEWSVDALQTEIEADSERRPLL